EATEVPNDVLRRLSREVEALLGMAGYGDLVSQGALRAAFLLHVKVSTPSMAVTRSKERAAHAWSAGDATRPVRRACRRQNAISEPAIRVARPPLFAMAASSAGRSEPGTKYCTEPVRARRAAKFRIGFMDGIHFADARNLTAIKRRGPR